MDEKESELERLEDQYKSIKQSPVTLLHGKLGKLGFDSLKDAFEFISALDRFATYDSKGNYYSIEITQINYNEQISNSLIDMFTAPLNTIPLTKKD